MIRHPWIPTCLFLIGTTLFAGGDKPYDPMADGRQQIKTAVAQAKKDNKHVLLQIGGNWCSWCLLLNKLYETDSDVAKALNDNYILVHLNTSPENKNEDILAELGYPQRFGFPVLVVLDQNGMRIHTQNSAYLEKGKGHDPKKVIGFLKDWSPEALKPAKPKS